MSPWARPSRRRSCRLAYSALHEFVRSDIVCPHSLTVSEKLCWVSSPGSACVPPCGWSLGVRSEEHTSELQSRFDLVCRLLLEKKKLEEKKNSRNADRK